MGIFPSTVAITRYVLSLSGSCPVSECTCYYPLLLLVFFDQEYFLLCTRWSLIVASYLFILWIYFSVSPRHVLKYLLLTDFAHMSCTGLNAAACRYLIESYLPLTCCKLLLWCVGLSRLWRGTLHKPASKSLVPCNITCSSLVTVMVC